MSATESACVPDDQLPVTILQARRKAAGHLFIAILLGVNALSLYRANVSHPQAWSGVLAPLDLLGLAVCALWAIGSVIEFVRPPRLILDSRGITQTSLLGARTIPWRDVDNFRSFRLLPFWWVELIIFDNHSPRAGHWSLRTIFRIPGAETTLGPGWAMKGEHLAALLNAGRRHWAGSPQSG